MLIKLSPQRRDDALTVLRDGDKLTINGVEYDFTPLPDGGTIPKDALDCEWIVSGVERIEGELNLTLLLPHGPDAPESVRFPEPIIDPVDGEVNLYGN